MFNSGLSSDERNLILSMAKAITIIADAVSENIDNIDFDEIIEDVNYYSLLVSGNTDNETPHEIKSMNKADFDEKIHNHEIAGYFGFKSDSVLLIEEMSELTKAVTKYLRITNPSYQALSKPISITEAIDNIAEELADVEIMLERIRFLLCIPREVIDSIKEQKTKRTLDLINKNKKDEGEDK